MGTNCGPALANICCYCCEAKFIDSLPQSDQPKYQYTYRFIDDLLGFNGMLPPMSVYSRHTYELMVMNSELRELAFKREPLNKIRVAARDSGMRNLLGDGRLKILDGTTTPDEVARITQVEGVIETMAPGEEEVPVA